MQEIETAFLDAEKKAGIPLNRKDFLAFLEKKGAVMRLSPKAIGIVFEDIEFSIVSKSLLKSATDEYINNSKCQIVTTYSPKNIPPGWRLTNNVIRELFSRENNEDITIMMPFISPEQFFDYRIEIKNAIEAGRGITVITLPPEKVFSAKKDDQEKAIRYFSKLGAKIVLMKKVWFHAKIICFGEETVFFGSANWTKGGFSKNFELGVLLGGEKAKQISNFISYIKGFE